MSNEQLIRSCQASIAQLMPLGYPTVDQTALRMGIRVRTLQRRLHAAGLTYTELVEMARFEIACHRLSIGVNRISEIAETLGYSDPGSFSRAFQRWAGMTPRDYRRRSRASTGRPEGTS